MDNVQAILDYAESNCRAHGAKLTIKRKQVLSGLIDTRRALSAYELVDYCKEQYGESLPPMSVYRILDFLQQENLVHKLDLANKYIACAHITCNHDHGVPQFLICCTCQRVDEITVDKSVIDSLKATIENAGFMVASPQLEMNCLCKQCSDKVA
jgi:Fur family zinc uptake transcriptional regulator